jgi:hypothetical protein
MPRLGRRYPVCHRMGTKFSGVALLPLVLYGLPALVELLLATSWLARAFARLDLLSGIIFDTINRDFISCNQI